jgi:RNA-binding protein
MTMRGKDRAVLRAHANRLSATVHVGHQGIVPGILQSLDDALRTHELVKVQLSKHSDRTPKVIAQELAEATQSEIVQVIGRTATFYRFNPDLKHESRED